jgi:hypothetical protein
MLKSVVNKIYDCGKCAVLAVMLFVPLISMISLQVLNIHPINILLSLIF